MSHVFTFTLAGSEDACLQWQAHFSEFLCATGLPLPPEVDIKIQTRGGGGSAAPATRSMQPPPATATRSMQPPAAAPPMMRPATTGANGGYPMQSPPTATTRPPARPAAAVAQVSSMLEQVRQAVRKHGAVGIAGIGRKFRIVDDDGSGRIDALEFAKVMRELGFKYTDPELNQLMTAFDLNGDGFVDYEEFLQTVRPPMSLRRKRLVQKVFEMLDTDKSGILTASDIKARFNPHGDPRVGNREKSPTAVAEEFLSTFDVCDHNGEVGPEEFVKYYQGVSASIDDDSYFELMMRNAWHMSGGQGQSQCTSCLHVLVVHRDDSETVEELMNDLGLDKDNRREIFQRLIAQGITDIKDVKLYE
eukprot:NODE_6743_length_1642_cov_20.211221.p1 GENE.NODE_6743_length_1642_cov_20.211221~~NODE_6743_length_1642_cov_20.211221.p1  ORF type:complete len:361 (-),score=143.09 NODE_6743_length_1642_cov_20.211221:462-1544(-)